MSTTPSTAASLMAELKRLRRSLSLGLRWRGEGMHGEAALNFLDADLLGLQNGAQDLSG
jgi:hypothetical protein